MKSPQFALTTAIPHLIYASVDEMTLKVEFKIGLSQTRGMLMGCPVLKRLRAGHGAVAARRARRALEAGRLRHDAAVLEDGSTKVGGLWVHDHAAQFEEGGIDWVPAIRH